jgi:hypothetical protein
MRKMKKEKKFIQFWNLNEIEKRFYDFLTPKRRLMKNKKSQKLFEKIFKPESKRKIDKKLKEILGD